MPVPDPSPSRRALLLAAAGVVTIGLAGCDTGPGETVGPGAAGGPEDPDVSLLSTVLQDLVAVAALVEATLAAHPGLGAALSPLATTHVDHRQVLVDVGSAEVPTAPRPGVVARRRRALATVLEAERAHARRLADAAAEAASGPFARLLAVMAAGIGQQVLGAAPEPAP